MIMISFLYLCVCFFLFRIIKFLLVASFIFLLSFFFARVLGFSLPYLIRLVFRVPSLGSVWLLWIYVELLAFHIAFVCQGFFSFVFHAVSHIYSFIHSSSLSAKQPAIGAVYPVSQSSRSVIHWLFFGYTSTHTHTHSHIFLFPIIIDCFSFYRCLFYLCCPSMVLCRSSWTVRKILFNYYFVSLLLSFTVAFCYCNHVLFCFGGVLLYFKWVVLVGFFLLFGNLVC